MYFLCYNVCMRGHTYSLDFRVRAVEFVLEGGSRSEACRIFKISSGTLFNWIKQFRLTGDLSPRPKGSKPWKLDHTAVLDYFKTHEDATLREAADHFDTAHSVIDYILRKHKITRKKNHALRRKKRRGQESIPGRTRTNRSAQNCLY